MVKRKRNVIGFSGVVADTLIPKIVLKPPKTKIDKIVAKHKRMPISNILLMMEKKMDFHVLLVFSNLEKGIDKGGDRTTLREND